MKEREAAISCVAQQREEDENEVSGGERQEGKGQRESNLLKVEESKEEGK